MSNLSTRKNQYLLSHYPRHSDGKLAKALGVDKEAVRRALKRGGAERSEEALLWIREHPDAELPAYTGEAPIPTTTFPLRRSDFAFALLPALIALAIYWRTLAPTVVGEDAGELATAAYTLGIAHPPGYPLWCLIAKLFTLIVPVGDIAWRVGLVSAVFGAGTTYVMALVALKCGAGRLGSLATGLLLAFSGEFWGQCTIPEVYTLNAFLMALCVLLLLAWYETRAATPLWVFAIVYGLSLSNHNTMHLLGPVFVGFVLCVDREPWRRWKRYLGMTLIALSMLVVYAYLPIRAAANPPVNWGDPHDWQRFWDVITRKQYQFAFTENPRSAGRFFQELTVFAQAYGEQFTWALAWLPALGIWALWRKDRFKAGLLAVMALWMALGFILITNFSVDHQSIWVNSVFWVPVYVLLSAFGGAAIHWISTLRVKGRSLLPAGIALTLACAFLPLRAHYREADKSDYYFARDYGLNLLKTMEPNAILFPTSDHATFPALYLQAVEGIRPDITIGNKYGYPEESLYKEMPAGLRRGFRRIPNEHEEQIIEDWVVGHTDRPVYFSKKGPLSSSGKSLITTGLLYKAVSDKNAKDDRDYWNEYQWHTLDAEKARGELSAEYILSDYWFARGRDAFAKNKPEDALKDFESALDIGGRNKESLNNIASACAENGQLEAAAKYYATALEEDPLYPMALVNLGKVYSQLGKKEEALLLFQRVLKKIPGDPEAHWMIVSLLEELGRSDEALQWLDRMAKAQPNDARVYKEMGMICLNQKQDALSARQLFARSLSLDKDQPELRKLMAQAETPTQGENISPPMPDQPGAFPSVPGGASGLAPDMPTMPTVPSMPVPALPQMPQTP